MSSFLQGILAGYGIAIPVGAIAILIVETGLRLGFRAGFAAGAGAATADFVYAALAALAGQTLAEALTPYALPLKIASAAVLIGLGAWGMWHAARRSTAPASAAQPALAVEAPRAIYARFVGLTLLNPLTIAYFAALILGRSAEIPGWAGRAAFVVGAALASLSWQSLLAATGALGHRHLSPRLQQGASFLGSLIVLGLGIRMLF
jgi:threonine/homoserine/homoserine lactone efflux protein